MFYKTSEHVPVTYSKMQPPKTAKQPFCFAYRISLLNPPLENKVWNLVRKDRDQSSFNRKHMSLQGSFSTGLCMQLGSRALRSGNITQEGPAVTDIHPLSGRSLAKEQEPGPQHTHSTDLSRRQPVLQSSLPWNRHRSSLVCGGGSWLCYSTCSV